MHSAGEGTGGTTAAPAASPPSTHVPGDTRPGPSPACRLAGPPPAPLLLRRRPRDHPPGWFLVQRRQVDCPPKYVPAAGAANRSTPQTPPAASPGTLATARVRE